MPSTRTETYDGIEIIKNNITTQPSDEVNNEFRLVQAAVDTKYFAAGTTKIKILGTVHLTTNHKAQVDKSHLTVSINPGGRKAHIYLLPENGTTATDSTTIDHITW